MTRDVLHIAWSGRIGGAEALLLQALRHWSAKEHAASNETEWRHHVALMSGHGPLVADIRSLNVPLHIFDLPIDGRFWLPGRLPRLIPFLRMIRTGEFDCIHVHCSVATAIAAGIAARCPIVFTHHGGQWSDSAIAGKGSAALKWKLLDRLVAAHVAVSDHVRRQLIRGYALPSESDRVRCIPNGLSPTDGSSFRENSENCGKGRFLIGAACRLVPGKGIDYLLAEAAACISRGVPLSIEIAGDGPMREPWERLAESLGIGEHVRFVGWVPAIRDWYRGLDLFCFVSALDEGFGMAMAEAMSEQVPVIAAKSGAVEELLRSPDVGLCIELREGVLCDALQWLYEHPSERNRIAAQGRRLIENAYGIDAMCARTLSLYDELADRAERGQKGSLTE